MTNAATLYQQAFALYDALSKDEKKLLVDWQTNVNASVETALCAKLRPMCDVMHRAMTVTNCDWGIHPMKPETQLRHLSKARDMARATMWNAAHCRSNDITGATDDILATLRLGQNISDAALIGSLVEMAIEGLAVSYVASHLSSFDGASRERLAAAVGDPAFEEVPSRAVKQEADFAERTAKELASMSAAELETNLTALAMEVGTNTSQVIQAESVIPWLEQIVESQRELAEALASSSADAYETWSRDLAELEKSNPLAESRLGFYDRYVDKVRRAAITRGMLIAALAVVQTGSDALSSHPDPATGQPFIYTETADGFELQSGYQTNGIPLKIQFK